MWTRKRGGKFSVENLYISATCLSFVFEASCGANIKVNERNFSAPLPGTAEDVSTDKKKPVHDYDRTPVWGQGGFAPLRGGGAEPPSSNRFKRQLEF
ncbi:hypothetical protein C4J81_12230 [Deltaproteobacteria bacterium Smac51]|nr:hypothetical protein C4J81_12230 [Deltaproteobacteria bacterium Smac51]